MSDLTHEQMAAALVLHGWEPYVEKLNPAACQFLVRMPETDDDDKMLIVGQESVFEAYRGKDFIRIYYMRTEWTHLRRADVSRVYRELVKRQHRGQS